MASCNRFLLAISCCAVISTFLLGVFYTSLEDNLDRERLVANLLDVKDYFVDNIAQDTRLSRYCNVEMPKREATASYDIAGWELKHIAINIRHGDRSPIHRIPGTISSKSANSKDRAEFLDPKAKEYIDKFKFLQLSRLTEVNVANSKDDEEHDVKAALNSQKAFHKSDHLLDIGQLTTRGFMQHIHLGEQFKQYYGSDFLKGITHSSAVYVRSTNYARTVQSVAALLIAMVPQVVRNKKSKLPIYFYPEDRDEVMHGLVSRALVAGTTGAISTAEVNSAGVATVPKVCPAALHYAKEQRKAFEVDPKIMKTLTDKLGPQITSKAIGQLSDATLPSYCHAQPLPCRTKAKPADRGSLFNLRGDGAAMSTVQEMLGATCVSTNDLEKMMDESDREYCQNFAGTEGGHTATSLSIYPFLREVMHHTVHAALHGEVPLEASTSLPKSVSKSPLKLSVFSGHDTVIAPVLAGLGVYRGDLCKWPGYASSIVFELWQPVQNTSAMAPPLQPVTTALRSLTKVFPSFARPSGAELSFQGRTHYANSFLRVYFNGEDVTQRIPTCAAERERLPAQQSVYSLQAQERGLSLCSLEALLAQLSSLIDTHATITQACAVNV